MLDKKNIYFNSEISTINYKYHFYNEFYTFLFNVITDFKEKDKELELLLTKTIGKNFETKLKANIKYGKSVSKRFFNLYPQLNTQFIIQHPFTVFNEETKKIISKGCDNRLVEWYSTEKFQRLKMLIDLRKKDVAAIRRRSKDEFLYKDILLRIINRDFSGLKDTNESIIFDVTYDLEFKDKQLKRFGNKFYKWMEDHEELIEENKLSYLTTHLLSL